MIVNKAYPIKAANGIEVNTSVPCHSSNYYSYSSRNIKYIVMHYTGNDKDTARANVQYSSGANRGASAHYFVDNTSIYQSVALNNAAWAVGGTKQYKHNDCRNLNSISIEMCCSGGRKVSARTIDNAAYLCAELCRYMGITADAVDKYVLRHYDVWAKSCPAQWASRNNSGWIGFKCKVKEILNGESEGLTMTQYDELKAEIAALKVENAEIKAENEKIKNAIGGTFIYNYIDDNMPDWAVPAIKAAMYKGAVQGSGEHGELGLNYKDICGIVREYRAGLYSKQ